MSSYFCLSFAFSPPFTFISSFFFFVHLDFLLPHPLLLLLNSLPYFFFFFIPFILVLISIFRFSSYIFFYYLFLSSIVLFCYFFFSEVSLRLCLVLLTVITSFPLFPYSFCFSCIFFSLFSLVSSRYVHLHLSSSSSPFFFLPRLCIYIFFPFPCLRYFYSVMPAFLPVFRSALFAKKKKWFSFTPIFHTFLLLIFFYLRFLLRS